MASGIAAASVAQDLAFTEILSNSINVANDDIGEFAELFNQTGSDLELVGCTFADSGSSHTIDSSLVVPAGGYVILGQTGSYAGMHGLVADYSYQDDFGLNNGGDSVTLACGGTTIAGFDWSGSNDALQIEGRSMQPAPGGDLNGPEYWCVTPQGNPYGTGAQQGTPRAASVACAVIDSCQVTAPASLPGVIANSSNPATVQYSATGHTDQTDGNDPLNTLIVEIGQGPVGVDPSAGGATPSAETIIAQGFEHASGANTCASSEWCYTTNPATYNVGGDQFDVSADRDSITPSEGSQLFGATDTENSNGGGNFDHQIIFQDLVISTHSNVTVAFDYNNVGLDTSDKMGWEIAYDGGAFGAYTQLGGGSSNTTSGGWQTVTIDVPAGTASVSLRLSFDFNGGDNAAFDNVVVQGIPAAGGNWIFTEISEDATWTDTSGIDQYTGDLTAPGTGNTDFRYGARISVDNGVTYTYCDTAGGSFDLADLGVGSTAETYDVTENSQFCEVMVDIGGIDPDPMAGFAGTTFAGNGRLALFGTDYGATPSAALSLEVGVGAVGETDDANITWTALPLTGYAAGVSYDFVGDVAFPSFNNGNGGAYEIFGRITGDGGLTYMSCSLPYHSGSLTVTAPTLTAGDYEVPSDENFTGVELSSHTFGLVWLASHMTTTGYDANSDVSVEFGLADGSEAAASDANAANFAWFSASPDQAYTSTAPDFSDRWTVDITLPSEGSYASAWRVRLDGQTWSYILTDGIAATTNGTVTTTADPNAPCLIFSEIIEGSSNNIVFFLIIINPDV